MGFELRCEPDWASQARTIEMLSPDLKVVDKEIGLPALPSISYEMYFRDGDSNEGVKKFCELLAPR